MEKSNGFQTWSIMKAPTKQNKLFNQGDDVMLNFSKPDVEQFFRTLSIENFAVSPDEKQLIFSSNLNGKFNLWGMDLPQTFPYPLTFNNQNNHGIHFEKQGRYVVVSFDYDGDEDTQLFAMPRNGGELKPLRVKEKERHMFGQLTEDGQTLYYTTSKNNPTFLNVYRYNIQNDTEELVLEGKDVPHYFIELSPNEQNFSFAKYFANTYILAFVQYEGEQLCLTSETAAQHTVQDVKFINDEDIYFITNYEADYTYLAHFNLKTKQFKKVTGVDKESFESLKYDKQRNVLYILSGKGVEDVLYTYDLNSGELTKLDTPVDVVEKMQLTEQGNLYILGRSATIPFNIYKKETQQEGWEELTYLRVPGVEQSQLVEPEVLTYPSYDGLEIEALFFKANEENSNGHVILWPHGGPQWAERKSFRSLFQFLVNRGYTIFAPNFRGSTHYGLTFTKMIEGDWGHGPRLDNIKGLDWLIENGYADRDKLLLMGGSYGGYMALLLHGRHADYFKAVVDIFGPSNLFSLIDTVPDHWKPMMKQWVGDPVENKDKLTEDSPITHLDGMTKPMLVIQGANDPRVVQAESDQIVEALKKKGREVEYIVLEDEGHGFSKKENEMQVYRAILEFLDRYI